MKKQYEVKDKEDSIKTFFLQYAERLSSEINYELRKKKRDIPDDVFGALYASIPDSVLNFFLKNIISKYTYQIRNSRII